MLLDRCGKTEADFPSGTQGLETHIRCARYCALGVADGEKPGLVCPVVGCGRTFGNMGALTCHRKAKHPGDCTISHARILSLLAKYNTQMVG